MEKEVKYAVGIGLCLILFKYTALWIGGWTGMVIYLFYYAIGFITILFASILAIKAISKKTLNRARVFSVSISLLALAVVVFQPIEWSIEKLKSPVVYAGSCKHTVSRVWLKLRADGSCEYNAGKFMESEMYTGIYHLKEDTIQINFHSSKVPKDIRTQFVINQLGIREIGDSIGHYHMFITKIDKLKR
ncbi:hypothetical protein Q0590_36380 [Rhodocytophaga aerolata]|uniref:Uncharacterized protein n=1 Tax=Rhodocytophaga aerolata TaxID=455078 RepID=A0ABT8RJY0_9BACT|nr:hypothetical protein [Rhodocytophaga aerolata]MDO1451809.1 hypothetical protein [Rhodocytophaga aerolata]